jgi:hypothetical protein
MGKGRPEVQRPHRPHQAERAAGQALAAYRGAEEEEQTLALRIANSRVELTQMEAEASLKAWRP